MPGVAARCPISVKLYADAAQLLLDQWEGQKKVRRKPDGQPELIQPSLAEWLNVDCAQVRVVLNELAFDAHHEQAGVTGTADIAQGKLTDALIRISTRPDARPNRLMEYLSTRTGLLEPRGVGVVAFPHRTFQEYLAACYLTDHNFPDDLVNLVRAEPNRWREVALLAGAKRRTARRRRSGCWRMPYARQSSRLNVRVTRAAVNLIVGPP